MFIQNEFGDLLNMNLFTELTREGNEIYAKCSTHQCNISIATYNTNQECTKAFNDLKREIASCGENIVWFGTWNAQDD